MNPYEEILNVMRNEGKKDNTAPIQIGIMADESSCKIGKLILSGSDLLVAEHLKTGYQKDENTLIGPLKSGDRVAVYRFSDELYLIFGKAGVNMGLFPSYIENDTALKGKKKQITPKEYEINFSTGQLTGRIIEGKEAIAVWIWLVLQTPRYRHYVYSWDYGNEFEDLIGQGYSKEYIEAVARKMTEDCLLVNENIQSISDFSVSMEDHTLSITFTANTIYGGIEFKDRAITRPVA